MKTGYLFFLSILLSPSLFAQKQACQGLHEGMFRLVDKLSGTTVIQRTKTQQIEENAGMGVKMIFDLTWVNDCTYELRAKEVVKGDQSLMGNKGDVLTIKITAVKTNSYVAVTTANFAELVLEKEIEILK